MFYSKLKEKKTTVEHNGYTKDHKRLKAIVDLFKVLTNFLRSSKSLPESEARLITISFTNLLLSWSPNHIN